MIDHEPFELESSDESDALHETQLGDALADDDQLAQVLPAIEATLNDESPGTGGYGLIELLSLSKTFAGRAWSLTQRAVEWGIRRFADVEVRRIHAEAEADKTRILAEAEADKIKAQAGKIEAESDVLRVQGTAVAEAIRVETALKAELREKLKQRGIDWTAEMDDGHLRIAVSKKKREDAGP